MQRTLALIQVSILIAVLGVGLVFWRADQRARAADARLACLERVQAVALSALLVPGESVDGDGRLQAATELARRTEQC